MFPQPAIDQPTISFFLHTCTHLYSDGLKQENASCLKDFRNRPHPVKLRMIYLRGTLEVCVCVCVCVLGGGVGMGMGGVQM